MTTSALAPCATIELIWEMDFCRSPSPIWTIVLTFGHFAASERTAAIEACDQALMPKPSWMPRVTCLVPQNAVLSVTPTLLSSWSIVIDTAAGFPAAELFSFPAGEAELSLADGELLHAARARAVAAAAMAPALRRQDVVLRIVRASSRGDGWGPARAKPLPPGHGPDRHTDPDRRGLDDQLDRLRRAGTEDDLLQLGQEQRAAQGADDGAGPAGRRGAAEHDGRDGRQEVRVAGGESRGADVAGEQDRPDPVEEPGEAVGDEAVAQHRVTGRVGRHRARPDHREPAADHGHPTDDAHDRDKGEGDPDDRREPEDAVRRKGRQRMRSGAGGAAAGDLEDGAQQQGVHRQGRHQRGDAQVDDRERTCQPGGDTRAERGEHRQPDPV